MPEEKTNELMDSVIGDRQASDSEYDVEHDKVKQKTLGDHVIDAVTLQSKTASRAFSSCKLAVIPSFQLG